MAEYVVANYTAEDLKDLTVFVHTANPVWGTNIERVFRGKVRQIVRVNPLTWGYPQTDSDTKMTTKKGDPLRDTF